MKNKGIYNTIIKSEPVNKGWSGDKKYCVETADGQRLLLRVSEQEKLERKKTEYDMMTRAYNHGVLTSRPIEFGLCDNGKGVYMLSEWLNGEDVETVLPHMTETEQFILGLKAGETLRKIHTISAPKEHEGGEMWFDVIDEQIKEYRECGVKFEGDDYVIGYIEKYRHKMERRVKCFRHSDYHVGNMMIVNDELHIIDFGLCDYGDPWEDLSGIVLGATYSPHFATGKLRGYFGCEPTQECFTQITFYIACNMLSSICWAAPVGQVEIDYYLLANKRILAWFDNMNTIVPTWYLKDFYIQWADSVPYKLKEPFNFSFLSKYGKVFKVFDNSYSGAICFGVEREGKKYFLKFAGAKTFDATCQNIEDIIMMLKISVPKYKDLQHPLLINQIDAGEIGGGFLAIYDWFDGEGCGYMHPETQKKFLALPNKDKLRVYDGILDFHTHVIECGYIAIDFNNGSTLYNFDNGNFAFCDIDFYAKHAQISGWSGIWGDPSLKSPEECRGYSVITEVSNVYTMGATAFYFFADDDKDSREKWTLSDGLYEVAKKAISEERSGRQQTIKQFITEWRAAI